MPKLIKITDDLPKEFNLDNYKALDKKSAVFWHHALQKRTVLYHYLQYDLENFSFSLGFGTNNKKMPLLTENEIIKIKEKAMLENFQNPSSTSLVFNIKLESGKNHIIDIYDDKYTGYFNKHLPVGDFKLKHLNLINYIINKHTIEETKAKTDESLPVHDLLHDYLKIWLSPSEYPICINPFYPDSVIFSELKKKLDEIREKIKINNRKPVERKDLIAWASYGLLPFFDLKLWELYYDYKITRSVMAVTLYPKGQYGEDTIRKSVEPLYFEYLEGDNFDFGSFEAIDTNKRLSVVDSLIRDCKINCVIA